MKTPWHYKKLSALFCAAVLSISALGLAGCGGQKKVDTSKPIPIKVAYSNGACNADLFVAYEKGFFKNEGLDVTMVQVNPAHISDAVGAGQVDAFQGMASKLVQPISNGLPVKVVTGIHTGCQSVLVRGDSPIKKIEDLKGKKIGVPGLADAGTILVKRALYLKGIKVDDKNSEVEFRVFDRNNLPQVLQSGQVDAITVGDPVGPISVKQYGDRVILDSAKDEPFASEYCCLGFVTTKLAKENPEAAKRFVIAVNKAAKWVQQHPEETAKLELDKKYVSGDLNLITSLLKSYNFNPSVTGGRKAIAAVAKEIARMGLIPANTDGEKFAKENFISFDGVPDTPAAE